MRSTAAKTLLALLVAAPALADPPAAQPAPVELPAVYDEHRWYVAAVTDYPGAVAVFEKP